MKKYSGINLKIQLERTPNIDKIVNFTGITPTKDINSMIKEIVAHKKK